MEDSCYEHYTDIVTFSMCTAANPILIKMFRPWPNGANLSSMAISAKKMTEKWVPALADVAPDSGCYMSEVSGSRISINVIRHLTAGSVFISQSDPREVDWKQSFYGVNYQKLYSIKARYDPYHVFYGNTSVGSDEWYVQESGALCRAGK